MGYKSKNKTSQGSILSRVKDLTTLVVGNSYHLRKHLSQEGMVIKDEVHDIIFKELSGIDVIDSDGNKYSGFEIFIRKPL